MKYNAAPWQTWATLNREITAAESMELEGVPGIKRKSARAFKVPINSRPAWEYYCTHFGIPFTYLAMTGNVLPPVVTAAQWAGQWNPGALDTLRSWQRDGLRWSHGRPGVMFHHPTGSGKTWTALMSALVYQGAVLEITRSAAAPKHARDYAMLSTWETYHAKPQSQRRKKDRWSSLSDYLDWCMREAPTPFGWVAEGQSLWGYRQRPVIVMSWDLLKRELPVLHGLAKRMPLTVIFDEIHTGKGHSRWEKKVETTAMEQGRVRVQESWEAKDNRVAAAMQVSRIAARRIGTTATPVPNRLTDWWGQLDLIDPFGWGSFWDFAKRYGLAYQGDYGMVADNTQVRAHARPYTPELNNRKASIVHEVDSKVVEAELPPFTRIVCTVPIEDQCQPAAVKSLIKQAQKLGRVARMEARLIEASARKRPWVQSMMTDWVTQGHGKVIVFTGRLREVSEWGKRFRTQFKGTKTRHAIEVIESSGKDSGEERDRKRVRYMEHPGPIILVCTTDAWGESIDLQDTDVSCCTHLPYTPRQLFQLEGRIKRLGGLRPRPMTQIYPMAEGTIDERLGAIIAEKLPDVEATSEYAENAQEMRDKLIGIPDPDQLAAELLALLNIDGS